VSVGEVFPKGRRMWCGDFVREDQAVEDTSSYPGITNLHENCCENPKSHPLGLSFHSFHASAPNSLHC
jgi:hypothetical protein